MLEIRIHGRGGQGVVTTAELLSVAAFIAGREAQAFPSFGSERTGAPVVSFCRIADRPIRRREPVIAPDALIVQDPTLLHQVDVFAGLNPEGFLLINTTRPVADLRISEVTERLAPERCATVPAGELGREHLGRPLPGGALLGAFVALSGIVPLDAVEQAIRQRFRGRLADGNVAAAQAAAALVAAEVPARA